MEEKFSQELLQNLKQQYTMSYPAIPELQRLEYNMDTLLYGTDLPDYHKAGQYM